MNRIRKTILLILTLWPVVYIFLFFTLIFDSMLEASQNRATGMPNLFNFIFPIHMFTMLLSLGLMVYYLVHLYQNKKIDGNNKMLWTIAFFFGNVIGMVVYWWLHILPSKTRTYKPAPHKP